jgi:predicted AAA+ superfamily ATPase
MQYRLQYTACRDELLRRLGEPAPALIQLVTGPRQVGKTTLLLEVASRFGPAAVYLACDDPRLALPETWEVAWSRVEGAARSSGKAVLLLDEIQHLADWSSRLKPEWDRLKRERIPVQVVASGSSALRLGHGSRETLAGRFERLELVHWSAASIASLLRIDPRRAAELSVRLGTYPGALPFRDDMARWAAYLRTVIAPAMIATSSPWSDRRPALLKRSRSRRLTGRSSR